MASSWIVKRGDQKRGPFTSAQLKSLADAGKIRESDLVTRKGSGQYVPARKVKGLFSATPNGSVSKRSSSSSQPATDEDYGTVEIIEDDYGTPDDFGSPDDFANDSNAEVEDYEDFDEFEDAVLLVEAPPPSKRGSGRRSNAMAPVSRGRGKRRAAEKPPKPRKVGKSNQAEVEEDDLGPWANLAYGVACVAGGVLLFFALGEEEPDWGGRGGLIKLALQIIYKIGGRWAVLVILILLSGLFFWSAFDQFRKADSAR